MSKTATPKSKLLRSLLLMEYDASIERVPDVDDLHKRYKKLALKYHPDRNNCKDGQFKKVSAAYEYLKPRAGTRTRKEAFDELVLTIVEGFMDPDVYKPADYTIHTKSRKG